ncbi:hypothetical protein HYZ78_04605 [Candidatus Microgenomates bacterium]|nr:hypothetical protein [Candidatus Microgenomates bacterium]
MHKILTASSLRSSVQAHSFGARTLQRVFGFQTKVKNVSGRNLWSELARLKQNPIVMQLEK